ncbi:carbohydrate kinase family protein [uncultured Jatrophihabitans sp.]|uniref:carbohydrate kinase family protein n=1 Tax=uncultured Jatrophihabitans sp. TaxID=1610747 RepID=UPI0035CA781A
MTRVVCLGDLLVDVHAALPGPLVFGSDTPAHIELRHGGGAANVAAWLATLGAAATFVGRVGDDVLGRDAVTRLRDTGVRTQIDVDPDRPTGTCIVLVGSDGERTMIPSAGANDAPPDLALLPADTDWLYVSGYPLLRDSSRGPIARAIGQARDRGRAVAVDAASAGPLTAFGAQRFLDSIGGGVTLFANVDEARVLVGDLEPAAAAQALATRCGSAVVKRGHAGAVWSDASGVRSVPAVPADAVDSTGAGDAFAAGFLAGGPTVADRLQLAADAAARAVSALGGRPPHGV